MAYPDDYSRDLTLDWGAFTPEVYAELLEKAAGIDRLPLETAAVGTTPKDLARFIRPNFRCDSMDGDEAVGLA